MWDGPSVAFSAEQKSATYSQLEERKVQGAPPKTPGIRFVLHFARVPQ
jgi:hypothetical protein